MKAKIETIILTILFMDRDKKLKKKIKLITILSVLSLTCIPVYATENTTEEVTETVTETETDNKTVIETEAVTETSSELSAEAFWHASQSSSTEQTTEETTETTTDSVINEPMVIPDGTVKGKLIVLSWLGIGAVYFLARKKICEKKARKLMPEQKGVRRIDDTESESDRNRRRYYAKMRKISRF